jgi:lipid-A-disaccharide synthase-like uncharacterized protein
MNNVIIYVIGFTAQALFSSRIFLQWFISEKHKKVLTPRLFWEISLFASFLLFLYGYFRSDFAIMLGQVLTYYIYIRNIQLQHEWKKIQIVLRIFILLFPVFILFYGYNNGIADRQILFNKEHIPTYLMVLGIVSQILFTLRFVYQWIYSEKRKESSLPMGFWIISFTGSSLILIYAIFRKDPVLFIGHITGVFAYSRNIHLLRKSWKPDLNHSDIK